MSDCKEVNSCHNECRNIDFKNIVGNSTIENGGFTGSLLKLAREHIENSKNKQEIGKDIAGQAYVAAMQQAITSAMQYELSVGEAKKNIEQIDTSISISKMQYELQCRELNLKEKIETDKLDIARAELNIRERESQKQLKILDEEIIKVKLQNEALLIEKDIAKIKLNQEKLILSKISAEVDKISADIAYLKEQTKNLLSQRKLIDAQIEEMKCKCEIDRDAANSRIELNDAQISKMQCDCSNSTKLATAQAELYSEQGKGFARNSKQKLFDTQAQAFGMIFADADRETIPSCFDDGALGSTYSSILSGLDD